MKQKLKGHDFMLAKQKEGGGFRWISTRVVTSSTGFSPGNSKHVPTHHLSHPNSHYCRNSHPGLPPSPEMAVLYHGCA